jgi:N-acetylglucosaminyl-diphospho-decaprenol L-rhamnosyltransferase
MPLSIDVVVVAYDHYELTDSCLRHLAQQTVPHRVQLVDNGSTDGTAQRLARDWPAVSVQSLATNSAFSTACNRGVAMGDGDVVVLINNDVDCHPDFLERLVARLEADPQVGSVAPLSVQPGEQRIDSFGMAADPTLAAFQRLRGRPVGEASEPGLVLTGPAGAVAAYRRAAWEQIGGLNEDLFAYMEDFDLALRLRTAGWRCAPAPDAVGVHLGSATHGDRSSRQRWHGGFGRGYMLRRYGVLRTRSAARTLLTELIVVAGDLVISRDVAALKGRLAGWRAARGCDRLPPPPPEAIDSAISLWRSLQLRRGVYGS